MKFSSKILFPLACLSLTLAAHAAHAAWPFATGALQNFSSPAIGDLDGDGKLEIVFASWDGKVYCTDTMGNLKWSYLIGNGAQLDSSPTLANVDNNPNTLEVLIGSPGDVGGARTGLFILSATGQLLLNQSVGPIYGSITVGDVNNDGEPEIYFGTATIKQQAPQPQIFGGKFYSMKPNGQYNFEIDLGKQVFSTSTIVPLGAVSASSGAPGASGILLQRVPQLNTSYGTTIEMRAPKGNLVWSYTFPNNEFTNVSISPALVVKSDGSKELVIGTSSGRLFAFNPRTGQVLWTKQFTNSIMGSVAVADLDGDNKPEIVFTATDNFSQPTLSNNIYAVDENGNVKWTTHIDRNQYGIFGHSGPSIADIDGDGHLDILIGTDRITSYPAGIIRFDSQGNIVGSVNEMGTVYSSPALADLDNNGTLELCYGVYGIPSTPSVPHTNGNYNCRNANLTQFQTSSLVTSPIRAPWPMIHHDNKRTGNFLTPQ